MNNKKLSGKDILLILLYSPGISGEFNEPVVGKTRITKMMFIFKKEVMRQFNNINETSMQEFFSYNYGPFSKELYDDIKFFISLNFIKEEITTNEISEAEVEEIIYWQSDNGSDELDEEECFSFEYKYYLTEKGVNYVKENLWTQLTDMQKDFLCKFKNRINSLTLEMLLEYVYNKYPKYTENSLIKSKYIKH